MHVNELSQVRLMPITPSLLRLIVKQHSHTAGEVGQANRIFYSAPRSTKNLFYLFGEPGLGINEEILMRKDFDSIKVKFNDQILTTTRLKWLKHGIVSPYCDQRVDKQIILKVSEINMKDCEQYEPAEKQTELFVEEK